MGPGAVLSLSACCLGRPGIPGGTTSCVVRPDLSPSGATDGTREIISQGVTWPANCKPPPPINYHPSLSLSIAASAFCVTSSRLMLLGVWCTILL